MSKRKYPTGSCRRVDPPASEAELLARAESLAHLELGELAAQMNMPVPRDIRHAKGWTGEFIELVLGADAGPRPEPDFRELAIELKTIPIRRNGRPRESTFVCNLSLVPDPHDSWGTSLVRRKLMRVLWIPIQADDGVPIARRQIGSPRIWSPSSRQESVLRADWEEIMEFVSLGDIDKLLSEHGEYLQIRPKAMNRSSRTRAYDTRGNPSASLPRGFYLRQRFTQQLINAGCDTPR